MTAEQFYDWHQSKIWISYLNFTFLYFLHNGILTKIPFIPLKLNHRKTLFYFALNFLPWEFLIIKKLDFEKTKATYYTIFKTDIIKVDLVYLISNFLINKKVRQIVGVWFTCNDLALAIYLLRSQIWLPS